MHTINVIQYTKYTHGRGIRAVKSGLRKLKNYNLYLSTRQISLSTCPRAALQFTKQIVRT